jgi:general secretion pathway protein G
MVYAKRSGFTMIEILVVVFIIGLLASLVGPRVINLMFKGQVSATKSTLQSLKAALADFKLDVGRFPTKAEGLEALVQNKGKSPKWNGTYLEGKTEAPLDGWDNEFIYNAPPEVYKDNYKYYEIISHGDPATEDDQTKWLKDGA